MADRNMEETGHRLLESLEGMHLRVPPNDAFVNTSVPSRINPFTTDTIQRYPLGTELQYAERKFRYALNGTVALAVGKLMQAVVPLAGAINQVTGGGAVDATTVTFTPAATPTDDLVANELTDGYIHFNSGTGLGYMHRIKSHPAITGATSGILTLYDPLVIAVASTAKATVLRNRWRKVIIHPSPATAQLAGVTVAAVAANAYCWLQVSGPCPVLIDGTVVIGNKVADSTAVDGAVIPAAGAGTDAELQTIGEVIAVNATTEYASIWLNILN